MVRGVHMLSIEAVQEWTLGELHVFYSLLRFIISNQHERDPPCIHDEIQRSTAQYIQSDPYHYGRLGLQH